MCFSATWPANVRDLAKKYMINPVQVVIGSLDLAAVHSVTQTILIVAEEEKWDYVSIPKSELKIFHLSLFEKLKTFSIIFLNVCISFTRFNS